MSPFRLLLLYLIPIFIQCLERSPEGGTSDNSEFAAIKTIHKQLDDNADGSVDFSESEEFVQTELCRTSNEEGDSESKTVCTDSEKSLKFHQTDTEITSTELWITWHQNKVFNWTNKDVLNWLVNYVELPQYSNAFREHHVTGRQLPYIAINAGQILQNSLLIVDSQHKQKIQLRAMDIILFGPPVQHGHWKDAILITSIFLCLFGVVYALRQRKLSRSRIDSFMADLRLKEDEIKKLKSKFKELEMLTEESVDGHTDNSSEKSESSCPLMMAPSPTSHSSDDESTMISRCKSCSTQEFSTANQEEIEVLQQRVWSLEKELGVKSEILQILQELLPECQMKEREQLEFRKSIGEEQMVLAQRACEKIKKRRSSLFGAFHLANSSVLEEAGIQISKAVNKMQSISEHFEEHHNRWNKIGNICGFHTTSPTVISPGSHSSAFGKTKPDKHDHATFTYSHGPHFSHGLSEFTFPSSSTSSSSHYYSRETYPDISNTGNISHTLPRVSHSLPLHGTTQPETKRYSLQVEPMSHVCVSNQTDSNDSPTDRTLTNSVNSATSLTGQPSTDNPHKTTSSVVTQDGDHMGQGDGVGSMKLKYGDNSERRRHLELGNKRAFSLISMDSHSSKRIQSLLRNRRK